MSWLLNVTSLLGYSFIFQTIIIQQSITICEHFHHVNTSTVVKLFYVYVWYSSGFIHKVKLNMKMPFAFKRIRGVWVASCIYGLFTFFSWNFLSSSELLPNISLSIVVHINAVLDLSPFLKSLLFYSSKNLHKYAVTQMTYRYMLSTSTLKTYRNKVEIICL